MQTRLYSSIAMIGAAPETVNSDPYGDGWVIEPEAQFPRPAETATPS